MPRPSFLKRLYIYQKERFPLLVHGLLIAAFSFSAIGYSGLCRGSNEFIPWPYFLACVYTNLSLFFLLRVSDEYKDSKDDQAYRRYLPVVRGLISLKELRNTGVLLFAIAVVINIVWFTVLLPLLGLAFVYLLLMRYEFGIGAWLKRHMHWYMITHMVIIPLADIYASSYDWKLNHLSPPPGLLFFFGVSFLNGMVLETGRKLRSSEQEEPGVDSYTKLWGLKTAPAIWLCLIGLNLLLACFAAAYGQAHTAVYYVLGGVFTLCIVPAFLFIAAPDRRYGKAIEIASLLWALTMYLALGGIPRLWSVITG